MTFPGEALLIKLWETLTEKGIGRLLSPWQTRREGAAQLEVRRTEVVALAAAERDAADLRSGRTRLIDVAAHYPLLSPEPPEMERLNSAKSPVEPLGALELATGRLVADAIRQEVNVAKALLLAEQRLQDDPQQPSQTNIAEDWLFRWRDYAGGVSAEQLQTLWGKLLAGELKSPGTYSLRALDFIRNLSPKEAENIALLSRFVFNGVISRSQQAVLDSEGVNLGFLLGMEDLGVVSGVLSAGLSNTYASSNTKRFDYCFCSHGRVLVVNHEDPIRTLSLNLYKLTEVGRQTLRLGTFAPHEEYLRKVGTEIKQKGFNVVLGSYCEVSEDEIEVFGQETL
jgi:hypothetical protein